MIAGRAFRFPFQSFLPFPPSSSSPLSFFFARKSSFGADDRIHDTRVPRFLERRRARRELHQEDVARLRLRSTLILYACACATQGILSLSLSSSFRFRFRWLAGRAPTHVRNLTVRSTSSVGQRSAEDGGCGGSRPRVSRSNKSNISPVNPNPLVPVVHGRGEDGVPRGGQRERGRAVVSSDSTLS